MKMDVLPLSRFPAVLAPAPGLVSGFSPPNCLVALFLVQSWAGREYRKSRIV